MSLDCHYKEKFVNVPKSFWKIPDSPSNMQGIMVVRCRFLEIFILIFFKKELFVSISSSTVCFYLIHEYLNFQKKVVIQIIVWVIFSQSLTVILIGSLPPFPSKIVYPACNWFIVLKRRYFWEHRHAMRHISIAYVSIVHW